MIRKLLVGMLLNTPLFALAADYEARLLWGQRLELGTPVSGRVEQILVQPGQRVKQGTVLLRLEQQLLRAKLAATKVTLQRSKQLQAEAKRELERTLELYERTLLADHDRQLAEIEATKAEAETQIAEAEHIAARLKLQYSELVAPFDGVIVAALTQVGVQLNNRFQVEPLIILADDKRMRAQIRIAENELDQFLSGRQARVAVSGEWYDGQVDQIGLEPIDQTEEKSWYAVTIAFSPPADVGLRQGQKAKVRIGE